MRRWLWILFAVPVAAFAVAVAAAWFAAPSPGSLPAHVHARLAGTSGREVALTSTAPILRDAVVATEDERFYRHHGIDVLGVLRAIPYDLVHLSYAQGASTITEQVAKLLYLDGNDHTPWRKLEDAMLALKLEDHYGKEQILAAYLDTTYLGEGTYGVADASEHYFGVTPKRLDAAQATLLAGLIQAPSAYDPLQHPERARARQVDVFRSFGRAISPRTRASRRSRGRCSFAAEPFCRPSKASRSTPAPRSSGGSSRSACPSRCSAPSRSSRRVCRDSASRTGSSRSAS